MHRTRIRVVADALDANDTIARANRGDFDRAGVAVVNLMSAPGAGKTTLLERALPSLERRVGVLEGDVQGSMDADRLASLHIPVAQLNTGAGFGGECHLDANMVRSALPSLPLEEIELLIVENVGNLVCPAEFRIGEDARAMVCSVAEGEDKPLKYPLMFRACELVVVNKIDLLPHLEIDLDLLLYNIRAVNPSARTILVSARTGEGIAGLVEWLSAVSGQTRPASTRPQRVTGDHDHTRGARRSERGPGRGGTAPGSSGRGAGVRRGPADTGERSGRRSQRQSSRANPKAVAPSGR